MSDLLDIREIKRVKVESSNIAEVGYDEDSKTLVVLFNNGRLYSYDEVPKKVYDDFLVAQSKGKYFIANVRGKYDYRKIP
jgi:hypothetical protein